MYVICEIKWSYIILLYSNMFIYFLFQIPSRWTTRAPAAWGSQTTDSTTRLRPCTPSSTPWKTCSWTRPLRPMQGAGEARRRRDPTPERPSWTPSISCTPCNRPTLTGNDWRREGRRGERRRCEGRRGERRRGEEPRRRRMRPTCSMCFTTDPIYEIWIWSSSRFIKDSTCNNLDHRCNNPDPTCNNPDPVCNNLDSSSCNNPELRLHRTSHCFTRNSICKNHGSWMERSWLWIELNARISNWKTKSWSSCTANGWPWNAPATTLLCFLDPHQRNSCLALPGYVTVIYKVSTYSGSGLSGSHSMDRNKDQTMTLHTLSYTLDLGICILEFGS